MIIPTPPVLGGNTEQKITQIYRYIFTLVEILNRELEGEDHGT